jgi:ribosomal-protein-alanine N-acetyltransferase
MNWSDTILTQRLRLVPFSLDDAAFLLHLVNSPNWIRFIGDRHVHSIPEAQAYLQRGILQLWADKGYGPYVASDRASGEKMAYVGWVKRDFLDAPDLGYACLPNFYRQGFVFEAANHLLQMARKARQWPHVYAITLPNNTASIGVLNKLGFTKYDAMLEQPENVWVDIYRHQL